MKRIHIIFLTVLILAVLIRILLSFIYAPKIVNGQHVSFETILLSEPTEHGNYQSVTVQYTNTLGSRQITLYVEPQNDLHYGQTVLISGVVKQKNRGLGKNIIAMSFPQVQVVSAKQNVLFKVSLFIRQKIQTLYEKIFSPEFAALLLGIVLGVKGNFSKSFLQDLQATGVMHVIAASGMNVTMVSGFFTGILSLFFRRKWVIAMTIVLLLFYCVLSGMQASIIRATVMIAFALIGQLFGRQYSGLYGLLLAASGMLLYNPTWISDVGFQLSFAATLGIFFIKPLLPSWKIISDDIGTTISAQIATIPILIGSFGTYGLLSVLVNALVLWTIPPLMVLGGVGGLVGLLFEPLGSLLLILATPLLWFFTSVVQYFGSFGWQIRIDSTSIVMILGYYLVVGSWVWIVRKQK